MYAMVLSDRQHDILNKAVFEYIDRAEPVSSSWLEEVYEMPFSPATIRNELSVLSEEGYLEQPHPSAGRVPTDKGYRFLVDELLNDADTDEIFVEGDWYEAGKRLAEASSNLIIFFVPQRGFLWKEGWEQVLQAPEFEHKGQLGNFTKFLRDIEKWIQGFQTEKSLDIYIGEENSFSEQKDFSIMISVSSFMKREKGFMAFVGPKRMTYQKNIGLLSSLWKKKS